MICKKKENGDWELYPEKPSETLFLRELMEKDMEINKVEGEKDNSKS